MPSISVLEIESESVCGRIGNYWFKFFNNVSNFNFIVMKLLLLPIFGLFF